MADDAGQLNCRLNPNRRHHGRPSPTWRPGSHRRHHGRIPFPYGRLPSVVEPRRGTVAIMAGRHHHGAQGVSVARRSCLLTFFIFEKEVETHGGRCQLLLALFAEVFFAIIALPPSPLVLSECSSEVTTVINRCIPLTSPWRRTVLNVAMLDSIVCNLAGSVASHAGSSPTTVEPER